MNQREKNNSNFFLLVNYLRPQNCPNRHSSYIVLIGNNHKCIHANLTSFGSPLSCTCAPYLMPFCHKIPLLCVTLFMNDSLFVKKIILISKTEEVRAEIHQAVLSKF